MRWAIVGLACASCHWAAGGFGRRGGAVDDDIVIDEGPHCHRLRAAPDTAAAAAPAAPHPDFARLAAYRSYFQITRVRDAADRYLVFADCAEASGQVYTVRADGSVRWEADHVDATAAPGDVPAERKAVAQRVLAQHATEYAGVTGARVMYLGAARTVEITEIMPVTVPGDPQARTTWYERAIVPMNASLTALAGAPGSFEGGETGLCAREGGLLDCSAPPRWIDFDATPADAPQLAALLYPSSPATAADRARFQAALIAALAHERGAKLDELLARQGTSLLPESFVQPLRAGFSVRAGGASIDLRVTLSPAEIAHGSARGTATATIDGVTLSLAIVATAEPPAPKRGAATPRLHFRYTLDDGRGNRRTGEVIDDVALIVDGAAGVVWSLGLDLQLNRHSHEPPVEQHLPGGTASSSLDASFGVEWMVDPWFPR